MVNNADLNPMLTLRAGVVPPWPLLTGNFVSASGYPLIIQARGATPRYRVLVTASASACYQSFHTGTIAISSSRTASGLLGSVVAPVVDPRTTMLRQRKC